MQTLIRLLNYFPSILAWVNRRTIDYFASTTTPRPHRFSLWSPTERRTPAPDENPPTQSNTKIKEFPPSDAVEYTSWPSLVDRTFTGRHLPPDVAGKKYPHADDIAEIFARKGEMKKNPRSSILLCFFAQWFTDSFLRTHPLDPRRNTSNHEIDLCQIYGLDETSTWALRSSQGGRLASRMLGNSEYPQFLYSNGVVNPRFRSADPINERGLSYLRAGREAAWAQALEDSLKGTITDPNRRDFLYAAGLDRGNSTIAYTAFNTIFLREHNRIAGLLEQNFLAWSDDRLFETARLINIRQLLNVVIDDYIRHLGGAFPFALDRTFGEKKQWYRANRISIEFNLLYRWHSLVPDEFKLAGQVLPHDKFRFNNALLELAGVERVITEASAQPAGRIGLQNTPAFMEAAERRGLKWSRDFRLQSFNSYRIRFGLKPYNTIEEFADGSEIAKKLSALYNNDMDAVEFVVGLFGEKRADNDTMPETLMRMVAYDAFTHILTNPVLSSEVHCVNTFSEVGMQIIDDRASLEEIIRRNCDPSKELRVSLSYR